MVNRSKKEILKQASVLNPKPKKVTDPGFRENAFFDPHDLVQVKYEMVRKVTHEGKPISEAARCFGFSRPAFYQAQNAIEREGLLGLVPKKTGPRTRHKLTSEIMAFIQKRLSENPSQTSLALAELVAEKFSVRVHPRSIERALDGEKKRDGQQ